MSTGLDKDFKMPVRVSAYLILGIALLGDRYPQSGSLLSSSTVPVTTSKFLLLTVRHDVAMKPNKH